MKKLLIPTEFTYLSKCALELGMQIADKSHSEVEVVSVVETANNVFMSGSVEYDQDPMTAVYNMRLTETELTKTRERVAELQEWSPELSIAPKVLLGEQVETLLKRVKHTDADMVIIGGDRYQADDIDADKFIRNSSSPVLSVKCKLDNLDLYKDIIFLSYPDKDSQELLRKILKLRVLLDARLHVLRINTPEHFLSTESSTKLLENYTKPYPSDNIELVTYDAENEQAGLLAYSQKFHHAFLAMGVHDRSFIQRLLRNNPEGQVIANSVHPVWTFKG